MAAPPPPPPEPAQPYSSYVPQKIRPSVVTKWALVTVILAIVCIIIGAVNLVYPYPLNLGVGIVAVIIGVYSIIAGIGMFAGKGWGLKMEGYNFMSWTKNPQVRAYFNLPPEYLAYPQSYAPGVPPPTPSPSAAPSAPVGPVPPPPSSAAAPACPTCGQPLTLISQYNRWYCQNEKKYV